MATLRRLSPDDGIWFYSGEVKAELLANVIKETHRLQRMHDAPETLSPHAEANAAGCRFSAIRASFQEVEPKCQSRSHITHGAQVN